MIAPDSTSYPFLALAQRHGVAYGHVLSYADWLVSGRSDLWVVEAIRVLPPSVLRCVARRCAADLQREQPQ